MIILYSKSMRLFVGSGFLVSHHELNKPRHFYGLSLLGTMSDHNWRVFHLRGGGGGGGIYPFLLIPDTYFPFHVTMRLYWTLSHLPTTPTQTLNAVSIYQPCTHTHEIRCFPCICNAKYHCMLAHVACIIHYMEQFINHILCQVPCIIISKAYNLHPFLLIYMTPIY